MHNRRAIKTIISRSCAAFALLMLCFTPSPAQEFLARWISIPDADDASHVWFRRDYTIERTPFMAEISVMSDGLFEVFVNGCNVSTDVMIPFDGDNPATLRRIRYNVADFLRKGSNTIAVRYSPEKTFWAGKQLSLSFYGEYYDGTVFGGFTDESWLCRQANSASFYGDYEYLNAEEYPYDWKAEEFDVATWMPAVRADDGKCLPITDALPFSDAYKVSKIMSPLSVEETEEGIVCDFGREFDGWIRVTLRDALPGETIEINGLLYVCSGATDEQACRKFTTSRCEKVIIKGDGYFKKEQIQKIEGLEITKYTRLNYRF